MNSRGLLLPMIFVANLVCAVGVDACTVFTASQNGTVLFAGNEDWKDPYNRIRFFPPEKGKHGRVYVGPARYGSGEMGMNDRGLVFDALSVPKFAVNPSGKPEYHSNLVEKALEECTTVAEVVQLFDRYDRSRYNHAQLMFADRTGDAVLIDANGMYRKKERHLLATNFRLSTVQPGSYPCQRFQIADRMLRASDEISVDLFRRILAATHMEGSGPTQYSIIFDLANVRFHLYHFHNFEQVVTIDVRSELAKGWHAAAVASLFTPTYAASTYVSSLKKPVTGTLLEAIADAGIESAAKKCEFLKEFEADHYDAGSSPVLVVGLELMWAGKVSEAVQWLQFAAKIYPREWDSHMCLAEAYVAAGDKTNARRCYEQAHKIKPNAAVREKLRALERG